MPYLKNLLQFKLTVPPLVPTPNPPSLNPSKSTPPPPSHPNSAPPQTNSASTQPSNDFSHTTPLDTSPKSNPPTNEHPQTKTFAQRAKSIADHFLTRLAPITLSASGVPQVLVPDEVFERGEALHRDFIIGVFFLQRCLPTKR